MKPAARLFMGQVMHRRLRPVANRFVYPVCFCLLPLSALEASANRLFSINRFNLLSFHYADHGARDGSHPLPWIRALLAQSGLHADGEIWLQCFPRMLGFVFNPVSFWFCHAADGTLVAVLAEVSNTFGQRHRYLLAHAAGRALAEGETLQAAKTFHVSPFLALQGHYRFRFYARSVDHAPFWRLARIEHADDAGDLLHTAISGQAVALDAAGVLRATLRYPFMTLLIVLRIHWQALKLWRKGAPFFRQPSSPLNDKQP
ncbi:DUF1365 domain-containing protein [Noviherbaspirillum soli]|uniref:DUF1365 domain-containing protein n=1 Tax=Noviherbaspirillum soli TaxID=1064518 RepID=UPI00188D387B|nr:DUF1365 domain-containing protein [Noviherbaspirillum soli]